MDNKYILSIDQSTQGTKALLFDEKGGLLKRADLSHRQIINEQGWVEHDLMEIYENTISVVKKIVDDIPEAARKIVALGICNQRETVAAWDKETGQPIYNAIVWQCSRGKDICKRIEQAGEAENIRKKTGLMLSPYFSAAKMNWIMENVSSAKDLAEAGRLCMGTIDSWLIYKLTKEKNFYTEYSNASRTQLFNINTLSWDEEICQMFHVPINALPKVCSSNDNFGSTNIVGILENEITIHGVIGDSQGALYAQGCLRAGMAKATIGTGSSIMMNIGKSPILSEKGIVTSLAGGFNGEVQYVLEGNINNAGSVITWLQNDLGLIQNSEETKHFAMIANQEDKTYIVPAFTGLGAPYWNSDATAMITGITRTTSKREIVKAALESIAYQISDIIFIMEEESNKKLSELRVDGGPSKNEYLMQFLCDMLNCSISTQKNEELSGMGAAFIAGLASNHYSNQILKNQGTEKTYSPQMQDTRRKEKLLGWKNAISKVLHEGCNIS